MEHGTEARVEYEMMRPGEIVAARERCPVAFIPIGPLEWHGPHLPLGTDGLHAHHVAVRVARAIGGVVLPTLFAGSETVRLPGPGAQRTAALGFDAGQRIVGMDFPGNPVKSLYFEESAFGITVREIVRGLKADPYRLLVLLNGHGAPNHQRTLERIAVEETVAGQVEVLYRTAWNPWTGPQMGPGHADQWETAVTLAFAEPLVSLGDLPARDQALHYADVGIVDGRAFDGFPTPDYSVPAESDPRAAQRAAGETFVRDAVATIVEEVRQALARQGV
jgi:creatinine amidohydrolase